MGPENFSREIEKAQEVNFPQNDNLEAQRPTEQELPSLKQSEIEDMSPNMEMPSNIEDLESERPEERELPHFKDEQEIKESNEIGKNCPIENGIWEGERGDSKWIPDPDYVPLKMNSENKTWKELSAEYGIDGVVFKDGEPDFGAIAKGEVEIEPFSTSRDDNFDKADMEMAKQKGCTPEEVAKWRKEQRYTWHECKDMKTMQMVPSIIHNNVSHRGGISEAKGGN